MRPLIDWLSGPAEPRRFPYSTVLREFHRTGKHFVERSTLVLLDDARRVAASQATGSGDAATWQLTAFLDIALDKWDGRYDYCSYLALRLLRLPCGAADPTPAAAVAVGRQARDRLLVRLVADTLAFEMAAATHSTGFLPRQRPGPAVVVKRCRLGVRAVAAALDRLGVAEAIGTGNPVTAAADLHGIARDLALSGDPSLRLTMLPVHVTHDEYLFIRMLQAYECLFAGVAEELRAAVAALTGDAPGAAADRLGYACDLLRSAGPLFSLLATMQPESFRTFRQYTEGASAIQSRSYKLIESLCRTPEADRLDSVAYQSVPEIQARVRGGQPTIEETYRSAVSDGRLTGTDNGRVARRMAAFAGALTQWRRTHLRVAVRMLGSRSGTGYTEGTPYLAAVSAAPVFTGTVGDSPTADPDGRRGA
ncbi:tryptophan 2,3-dioxygenase family protein [Micromonospora sp. DT48]|uniref:tryptophan 2,3-dioxygenase family protein n=1 Tax=Micromonospora sp. DT48 TaxID=3393429 RepID=UPI003CEED531